MNAANCVLPVIYQQSGSSKLRQYSTGNQRGVRVRVGCVSTRVRSLRGSINTEEEGEYEIECIFDHRDNGGVQQFRVRWRGYSSGDDTWQALDTIEHTEAFEKYLPSMSAFATRKY